MGLLRFIRSIQEERARRKEAEKFEAEIREELIRMICSSPEYDQKLPWGAPDHYWKYPARYEPYLYWREVLRQLVSHAKYAKKEGEPFYVTVRRVPAHDGTVDVGRGCASLWNECSLAGCCQYDPCENYIPETVAVPEQLDIKLVYGKEAKNA